MIASWNRSMRTVVPFTGDLGKLELVEPDHVALAVDDIAWRVERVERPHGDPAAVALLPGDAEVSELETATLADEDVERRQVAVQHLAAVQLAEHLQDARDLTPRGRLRPAPARAMEEGTEVALPRILQGKAVENAAVLSQQGKGVEHADRTRMIVQELAEVRLAQPPVDAGAHLDADDLRDDR
jgi:hypothetical protein